MLNSKEESLCWVVHMQLFCIVHFPIQFTGSFKMSHIVLWPLKVIHFILQYRQFSLYKFKMFSMALIYFVILVWATSALYLVKIKDGVTFLYCCYEITQLFFLISHGYSDQSVSIRVLCFEIVCTLMGVVLQLIFFGKIYIKFKCLMPFHIL